jgi:hypothetical protein
MFGRAALLLSLLLAAPAFAQLVKPPPGPVAAGKLT